jgi:RNA polymerase sigma factor (sigma-70 family)
MNTHSGMSDERLFIRYSRGDTEAFRVLMERYANRLVRFCRGYLADQEEAEDVVQDTFLRAIRSAGTYRTTARFSTWIHTIARNLCLDRLKVARRRGELMEAHGVELAPAAVTGEEEPEFPTGGLEPEQVREALERLSPAERETIRLTYYADWSTHRIARLQACSETTVRVRRHHAIRKLRSMLGLEGPGRGLITAEANGNG